MKQLIGLDETATPNDAFSRITLGNKRYGINLYVKYEDGTPASGITITSSGSPPIDDNMVTDENGYLFLAQDSPEFTASIDNAGGIMYVDMEDNPNIQQTLNQTISNATLVFNYYDGYRTITNSRNYTISDLQSSFDITAVGGGGGSGMHTFSYPAAGGGGGGYVSTVTNVPITSNRQIVISVGNGGSCATGSTLIGGSGGTTSVSYVGGNNIVSANGGNGGGSSQSPLPGGIGNGNGGNGGPYSSSALDNGKDGSGYIFNEQSLGLAGGGGGGGGNRGSEDKHSPASGGKPYGGSGALEWYAINARNGIGPGGGGGGITENAERNGNGHQGCVYLRFHH